MTVLATNFMPSTHAGLVLPSSIKEADTTETTFHSSANLQLHEQLEALLPDSSIRGSYGTPDRVTGNQVFELLHHTDEGGVWA